MKKLTQRGIGALTLAAALALALPAQANDLDYECGDLSPLGGNYDEANDLTGNVVVPAGNTCTLNGDFANANFAVAAGATLVLEAGTFLNGNVATAGTVTVANAEVNGNFIASNGAVVGLDTGAVVRGNVSHSGGAGGLVDFTGGGATVNGDVEVSDPATFAASGGSAINEIFGTLKCIGFSFADGTATEWDGGDTDGLEVGTYLCGPAPTVPPPSLAELLVGLDFTSLCPHSASTRGDVCSALGPDVDFYQPETIGLFPPTSLASKSANLCVCPDTATVTRTIRRCFPQDGLLDVCAGRDFLGMDATSLIHIGAESCQYVTLYMGGTALKLLFCDDVIE